MSSSAADTAARILAARQRLAEAEADAAASRGRTEYWRRQIGDLQRQAGYRYDADTGMLTFARSPGDA